MNWLAIFFGLGCVAAIVAAAHSPRDGRWQAVSLSCLLIVNWALFVLAYTDWSPKWALEHAGIETSSVHLWMIADTVCGCAAILSAYRFWWGKALFSIAIVQMCFHSAVDSNLLDPAVYTDVLLNAALLSQLAVFFVIGGPGLGDHLRHRIARLRISGRFSASGSASTRKAG